MKPPIKTLTGLLAVTLAWQTAACPAAQASEFSLALNDREGSTGLNQASSLVASSSLQLNGLAVDKDSWSDLSFPAPDDPYTTLELGHLREAMSASHFVLGTATLGFLSLAGLSGILLVQQNDPNLRLAHQWMVGLGTATYLADGSLMLFAPKPFEAKGESHLSNIEVHKYLFWLHLAGMTSAVATGLIATRIWGLDPNNDIRRTHPAIGATAIGLIGLSATVMALNF